MNTQRSKWRRVSSATALVMSVTLASASIARAEPVAEPSAPARSKVPAYVALGVAGAGVVVGTIYGLGALSAQKDFKANPTDGAADRAESKALVSDIAFGAAFASGVTALVLLLTDGSRARSAATTDTSRSKALITPIVSTSGAGLGAVVSF
jgi:hypothetical protein